MFDILTHITQTKIAMSYDPSIVGRYGNLVEIWAADNYSAAWVSDRIAEYRDGEHGGSVNEIEA